MISEFFLGIWNTFLGMLVAFGVLVAVILAILVLSGLDSNARQRAQADRIKREVEPAKRKVEGIVSEHLDTLARKRAALVRADAYGVVEASGWQKEVQHFVDKVVVPQLSPLELAAIHGEGINAVFQVLIEDRVAERQEAMKNELGSIHGLSAFEFEQWCEAQLTRCGWKAQRTKNGADQGADVIAERNGVRVAIQCKLYSRPVGNGAVQEVHASRQFYRTDASAVVTNAGFTPAAEQLAASTGVLLLSHTEIGLLAKRLGLE